MGAIRIERRFLLLSGVTGLAAIVLAWRSAGAFAANVLKISHSDEEWRRLLTAEQYAVLRQEATERPFSSKLLHENRSGLFACAGCDLDLFSSETKFESGTGWPSFWRVLPHAVDTRMEGTIGMVQEEVHCSRCEGHLGHVYNDGPKPTGLRYCMNGLALTFKPAGSKSQS